MSPAIAKHDSRSSSTHSTPPSVLERVNLCLQRQIEEARPWRLLVGGVGTCSVFAGRQGRDWHWPASSARRSIKNWPHRQSRYAFLVLHLRLPQFSRFQGSQITVRRLNHHVRERMSHRVPHSFHISISKVTGMVAPYLGPICNATIEHSRIILGKTLTKSGKPLLFVPHNSVQPLLRASGTRNIPSIRRRAMSNVSDVRMRLTRPNWRLSNQLAVKCHMKSLENTRTTVRKITISSEVPDANGR